MLCDRRNLSSLDFQAHPGGAHAHRAPDAEGAVYAPTQVARPQTSRSPIQNETGGFQNERRFLDGRAIAGVDTTTGPPLVDGRQTRPYSSGCADHSADQLTDLTKPQHSTCDCDTEHPVLGAQAHGAECALKKRRVEDHDLEQE